MKLIPHAKNTFLSRLRLSKAGKALLSTCAIAMFFTTGSIALADDSIPNKLFDGQIVPEEVNKQIAQQVNYPQAAPPPKDNMVPADSQHHYFPTRNDHQAYMLHLDKTINVTDALNRFYYDPKWRGEVWVPTDPITLPEKLTRNMATWPEYDQQNIYRLGNGIAKFFEKYSGFGP